MWDLISLTRIEPSPPVTEGKVLQLWFFLLVSSYIQIKLFRLHISVLGFSLGCPFSKWGVGGEGCGRC